MPNFSNISQGVLELRHLKSSVKGQVMMFHCVEYIKLDTCVIFHDHRINNSKVMMGGPHAPPP